MVSPVDQISYPQSTTSFSHDQSHNEEGGGVDIVAAIWRYKWAVFLPSLVGLVIGGLIWSRLPEQYESSTRLLVETDSPVILETKSGEIMTTVPGSDVIQSQLFSDSVLQAAWQKLQQKEQVEGGGVPPSEVLDLEFGGSFAKFAAEKVRFVAETDDSQKARSLAFKISVRHSNSDLVELSVQSIQEALIAYFQAKNSDSLKQLSEYIKSARDEHYPALQRLEQEYRDWKKNVQLHWDENGKAINPHRVEQNRLMARRSELDLQYLSNLAQFNAVEQTLKNTEDPRVAIRIVGQLLNRELVLPIQEKRRLAFGDEDFDLRRLDFEERLLPLKVDRRRMAAQYGENHPGVRELDDQIRYSEELYQRIGKEITDRIASLLDNSEEEKQEAAVAAEAVITTLRGQNAVVKQQLDDLDKQISKARSDAEALAKEEQENESRLAEIRRAVELLGQLDEQMSRVNLADGETSLSLTTLTSPTAAYIVGPNVLFWLASGLGIGLMFGCALAYMMEGQAGTFRSADEIAATLGVNILSHVPYDPGRRRKRKGIEADPYESLDEKLSVLHRPHSVAAEAIRTCRTSVMFDANSYNSQIIQLTSPLPADGKTTLVGNLAVSLAQAGKRVLLIDADLRRPQLSDNFGLSDKEGLTNVLNEECEPMEAIHQTPVENLSVMPSGPIPVNPAEALTLPSTGELLQMLRSQYDYILVDSPPLLVVTDASIIAGLVDGVVLTVKIRRKSRANAREAVAILRQTGARIIGVIVNASDDSVGSDGYRGYGNYRYSHYASRYRGRYGNSVDGNGSASRPNGSKRPTLLVTGPVRRPKPEMESDPPDSWNEQ